MHLPLVCKFNSAKLVVSYSSNNQSRRSLASYTSTLQHWAMRSVTLLSQRDTNQVANLYDTPDRADMEMSWKVFSKIAIFPFIPPIVRTLIHCVEELVSYRESALSGHFLYNTTGKVCIMMCRISSMYYHSRKVIRFLAVGCILETVSSIIIKVYLDKSAQYRPDPVKGIHVCTKLPNQYWVFAYAIPPILFESMLLAMALSKGIGYYRSRRNISGLSWGQPTLTQVLFRDSITFPFVTLMVIVSYMLTLAHLPIVDNQVSFIFFSFWPSIAGPRLILNLRDAYYKPFEEECSDLYIYGDHETISGTAA
ncbi:hypothetical protein JR316_0003984 [Psilocybe cubensis]|uniref:Uncharacterized protein n=1 Tax=Psilocybe cubensis TaxID=181762 RepID=A0ACB8HA06_PSICU|nr:hypothetical protein JR316_0003984 [Psilocybe cubensis]KAH9484502.1 hypothetical protein JR316_0003984 [Psilocybe cubensis]